MDELTQPPISVPPPQPQPPVPPITMGRKVLHFCFGLLGYYLITAIITWITSGLGFTALGSISLWLSLPVTVALIVYLRRSGHRYIAHGVLAAFLLPVIGAALLFGACLLGSK